MLSDHTVCGSDGAEVQVISTIINDTISDAVGKTGQHNLEEHGGNLTSAKASFTKK